MVGNLIGYPVGSRLVIRLGIDRLLTCGTLGGLDDRTQMPLAIGMAGASIAGLAALICVRAFVARGRR